MSEPTWIEPFVARLRKLDPPDDPAATDRGTLARLRRGLGKPTVESLAAVGGLFATVPDRDVDDAVLVARLFAEHRLPNGSGSIGAALSKLREAAQESTDKRFVHLVDSNRDDLPDRLRQTVRLLAAKDVPVDWAILLKDLRGWDYENRPVQWRWSRDYWKAPAVVTETEPELQPADVE